MLMALCFEFSIISTQAGATWKPRYVGTTVGGLVAPSGYYEYLPASYNANSLTNYPLLIFVHGSGQWGDGTATNPTNGLANILGAGLCQIIQNNTFPVAQSGGVLDTNNVIVLCPQCGNPWPMADVTFRNFYNFALAAYPKIDRRRIWFTGLSYGSTCVTTAMDYTQDPSPDDAAAVVGCAWRGDDFNAPIVNPPIAAIGKVVPLWLLTSQGDNSSNPDLCVSTLAAAIKGSAAPDSVFPSGSFAIPYTAYFNGTAWTLSSTQVDPITGVNPKITYFTGSDHNSWDRTYGNTNMWAWLFQQQKPDVAILTPTTNIVSPQGYPLTISGAAADQNGNAIHGSQLLWLDNIDGTLGTGDSITVSNLSVGAHIVKLQATDNAYHDNKATINVTVPCTGAFASVFDFGPTGMHSMGWNDITSTSSTTITNAVDVNGNPIGINLAILSPFVGTQNGGVIASNLYPLTAQESTMYVGGVGYAQTAELLISGLDPTAPYNLKFFASRNATDDRTSTYSVNGYTVSLQAAGNTSNTAWFSDVMPNSSGQLSITIGHGPSATFGYLGVLTITTTAMPLSPLDAFHAMDNFEDAATPGHDGVPNIVKFAFNMTTNNYADLSVYNHQIMTPDGVSGLPLMQLDASNHLTIIAVQRRAYTDPGIAYIPEASSSLSGPWTQIMATASSTPIDFTWERVVYTDTATPANSPVRFVQLKISY